jgi:hypothetical protein
LILYHSNGSVNVLMVPRHFSFGSTLILDPTRLIFLYGVGIRKFSLHPQNVVFLFGSVPFIRMDPLPFTTIELSAFINTF